MRPTRHITRIAPRTSSSCLRPRHLQTRTPRLESWCRGMQWMLRLRGIPSSWAKVRRFSSVFQSVCRAALFLFSITDPFSLSKVVDVGGPHWRFLRGSMEVRQCARETAPSGVYRAAVGFRGNPHGPFFFCPDSGEAAATGRPTHPGVQGFRASDTAS